jgi:hypothetical protein
MKLIDKFGTRCGFEIIRQGEALRGAKKISGNSPPEQTSK